MKGKNYSYSDAKGSYGIEVHITPHMLHQIKEIDKQYLVGILKDQEFSRVHPGSWVGKCPYCSSTKKRNSQVSYQPAYLNPNNMGYVFHCCSCMTSTTAYKLLLAVKGHSVAEEYLEARWRANQLAGGGFNCPLPQSVRERFLSEKEQRKTAHKNEYERRKARNYIAKYGRMPNGQIFTELNLKDEEQKSFG
jgi:hypothetical protein